jgi:hypothetical protein
MACHKKDKYSIDYRPCKVVPDFLGLAVYVIVVLSLLTFVSCSTLAPNTSAALESLPEEAFTPLWMVLEGVCLDLFNLIKCIVF